MSRCLMIGFALIALCGASTFVQARPPTVMNSPGYDARLKESRSALGGSSTTAMPLKPPVATPKRVKKKHTN